MSRRFKQFQHTWRKIWTRRVEKTSDSRLRVRKRRKLLRQPRRWWGEKKWSFLMPKRKKSVDQRKSLEVKYSWVTRFLLYSSGSLVFSTYIRCYKKWVQSLQFWIQRKKYPRIWGYWKTSGWIRCVGLFNRKIPNVQFDARRTEV